MSYGKPRDSIVVHVDKLQTFLDAQPRRRDQNNNSTNSDKARVAAGARIIAEWKKRVSRI